MNAPRPPLPARFPAIVFAALLTACGGGDPGSNDEATDRLEFAASGEPLPPTTTDEAPAAGGETAPPPMDFEREVAASAGCPSPSYARPRIAAWDMSRDSTEARQALLAKFDFAVVNQGPEALGAFAAGIRQIHPATHVAKYLNVLDLRPTSNSSIESIDAVRAADVNRWWLTAADGEPASWTGGTTWALNISGFTRADSSGQRWPQFKAQFDWDTTLRLAPEVDYVFTANTLVRPRVVGDWKQAGVDLAPSDPTAQTALRAGYAAYWTALRAAGPKLRIMAAPDNDLSSPEYKGQAEAAFLDGLIGQPWSLEAWAGWDDMMRRYRSALANVKAGKQVIFAAYGATPTDYAMMRYGLASSLLDDGLYMFRPRSGSQTPALYDEYLAPLGKALEAPPIAPASNGVWMRRFENGLVLVNPRRSAASIDVGGGYRRLAGTQDPLTNNGQSQTLVTLPSRAGLLMLKVPAPCIDLASLARPPVAALDYSRDTSDARKALLAKFDASILGLGTSLGAARISAFVSGIKQLNPSTKVGQYEIFNEIKCSMDSEAEKYRLWQEVDRNNWWLHNAAGQRVQWTADYGTCEININPATPDNPEGLSWPQFKWQFERTTLFSMAPFDFVFSDNTFGKTRTTADWLRAGSDQPKGDPAASAAMRRGHVAFWDAIRATSTLAIVGNADNDLSSPEYQGQLDGAFLEGAIGRSWSKETWAGWDAMMTYYRAALHNARHPEMVFLQTYADPTDYATVRYGLASAMLEDGHFIHTPSTGTFEPSWFDEFDAPVGTAAESPPTAPAQNGIWMRRYTNGIVLVNPSKTTSASIDVGEGYKRLSGTQDPTVNNGQAQRIVTLGPRQGLLMIRQ